MSIAREVLVSLLSVGVLLGSVNAAAEKPRAASVYCPRKFTDEQIQRMLVEKLPIGSEVGVRVRYEHCVYQVVMWPIGHPVDSDVFIELDKNGNLPPEVIKYGWHGDEHADVSIRKASVPRYPSRALAAKITGSVVVRATVTPIARHRDSATGQPEGFITDARIAQVSPPGASALTDGLIDVLRTWVFYSRMRYGTALPRDIILRFRFSIAGKYGATSEPIEPPADVTVMDAIDIKG